MPRRFILAAVVGGFLGLIAGDQTRLGSWILRLLGIPGISSTQIGYAIAGVAAVSGLLVAIVYSRLLGIALIVFAAVMVLSMMFIPARLPSPGGW